MQLHRFREMPPSEHEEKFGKLKTELRTFIADHGGQPPRETKNHPGRHLAMQIRNFRRRKDLTKEQLAELDVLIQNASQAPEASAERLAKEEDWQPKRRIILRTS